MPRISRITRSRHEDARFFGPHPCYSRYPLFPLLPNSGDWGHSPIFAAHFLPCFHASRGNARLGRFATPKRGRRCRNLPGRRYEHATRLHLRYDAKRRNKAQSCQAVAGGLSWSRWAPVSCPRPGAWPRVSKQRRDFRSNIPARSGDLRRARQAARLFIPRRPRVESVWKRVRMEPLFAQGERP
jgi:hypothetical protein